MSETSEMLSAMSIVGSFSSDASISEEMFIAYSCEGEGCNDLEQFGLNFPCQTSFSFNASFED